MRKQITLIIFILLLNTTKAYIDPGTGGMILNSIGSWVIGILSAIFGFIILYFFRPLKNKIKKLFKKK